MGAQEPTTIAPAPKVSPRRPIGVRGFVVSFLALLLLFYTAYALSEDSRAVQLHLLAIARAAHFVLTPIYEVERVGTTLSGEAFSEDVGIGCDAAYPILCFAAGVLAFPSPLRAKLLGLLCGIAILEISNVIRIATLFAIGVRFPESFHLFHTQVWEGLFVLLALVLWSIWALRVLRRP